MKRVLILEENAGRRAEFERVAQSMGLEIKVWDDALAMQSECEHYFPDTALISLEHDLDHGCGLDVAKFLAERKPVCPVIVHTSNTDRSFSMYNELRFASWMVDRVGPIGERWVDKYWATKARELMAAR
jgi:DNA-binding NtrC family response regulator